MIWSLKWDQKVSYTDFTEVSRTIFIYHFFYLFFCIHQQKLFGMEVTSVHRYTIENGRFFAYKMSQKIWNHTKYLIFLIFTNFYCVQFISVIQTGFQHFPKYLLCSTEKIIWFFHYFTFTVSLWNFVGEILSSDS